MIINIIIIIFFIISIYFTIKYKFIQLKSPIIALNELKTNDKNTYDTFITSLASHLGTGNIVGISSAIIVGGIGSIFWMWVHAIFTSILSLMENTIGVKYRIFIDGQYRGGSPYYIERLGLKNISIIISIFLILSNTIFFQPIQVKTVSESIHLCFDIPKIIIFIFLLLFTVIKIFKGTKTIIKINEIIVPIMSITFIIIGISVIIINIKIMPKIFIQILKEAFSKKAIFSSCIIIGFKRSLFSHEAGLGSMPTISALTSSKPIKQGFISCFGVFIDTIFLCSLTAFMIIIYSNNNSLNEVSLLIDVFTNMFGSFGKYLSTFFMFTFGLATIVSQYYLGESSLVFLQKVTKLKLKIVFNFLFIFGLVLGVFLDTSSIWNIIDLGLILLGIVNIYAICKYEKTFSLELKSI